MKHENPSIFGLADRVKTKLSGLLNIKKSPEQLKEEEAIKKADQEHAWFGKSFTLFVTLTLWLILPINIATMYLGIRADTERWTAVPEQVVIQSLMITGTIGVIMWVSWYGLASFAPRCRVWWASISIGFCSVLVMCFGLTASGIATLIGTTHAMSRPFYMSQKLEEAATRVNLIMDSSSNARAILPSLGAVESEACNSANFEARTGGITRTGTGFGAGTAAFQSACSGVGSVRQSLKNKAGTTQIGADKINANLERLFSLVDDRNIPILEREDAFRKGMAGLDRLIREYRSQGLGKAVQSSVSTLRNLVPAVDESSGINARTISAINGIRTKLNGAADELEKVIGGSDQSILKPIAYRDGLAVISLNYIHQFPQYIAIAAALDVFPFFTLWILMVYSAQRRKRKNKDVHFDNELVLNPHIPSELFESKFKKESHDD